MIETEAVVIQRDGERVTVESQVSGGGVASARPAAVAAAATPCSASGRGLPVWRWRRTWMSSPGIG